MKIAVAQLDFELGDISANLKTIASTIDEAASQNVKLVVFPEMCDLGYSLSVIKKEAQSWNQPSSPIEQIKTFAKEKGIYVAIGVSEKVKKTIYNTLSIITPKGELLAKYRKAHLATVADIREHRTITPGDSIACIDIEGIRFGMIICYDIRFPELTLAMTKTGAHAFIFPAAFPKSRGSHLHHLTIARAIENQAYFLGANRCGTDGKATFAGISKIVGPSGEILSEANDRDPKLLVAEIDKDKVLEARSKIKALEERRDNLYNSEIKIFP